MSWIPYADPGSAEICTYCTCPLGLGTFELAYLIKKKVWDIWEVGIAGHDQQSSPAGFKTTKILLESPIGPSNVAGISVGGKGGSLLFLERTKVQPPSVWSTDG